MLSQTLPMNPVSVLGSTPASHTGGSPASTAPSFAPVAGGYGSPSRSAPSGWAPTILWAVVSLVPSAPGLQLTSASLNNVTVRIHQYQIIPKASPSIPLHNGRLPVQSAAYANKLTRSFRPRPASPYYSKGTPYHSIGGWGSEPTALRTG